ncbi:hypothetical protein HYV84_04980 [Candidatus Woesearchaeota archaeon]|nr:hypothetical protein [Candidatus Woesearchaeota archaeon]
MGKDKVKDGGIASSLRSLGRISKHATILDGASAPTTGQRPDGMVAFKKKPSKQAWIFIIGTGIISFLNWNDMFRAFIGLAGAAVSLWLSRRGISIL